MADGLTDDEILAMTTVPEPVPQAPVERDPQRVRANAIVKDIYARHGIKPDVPLAKAMEYVAANAQIHGMADDSLQSTSGWRNPEERAAAREAYARQGKTPQEVKERWDKSAYLMDPQTAHFYQNFMRDSDFLADYAAADAAPSRGELGWRAENDEATKLAGALDFWDRSNNARTYRDGVTSANYSAVGGLGGAVANATSNPDVTFGDYSNFSEVVPDYLRMRGSGEVKDDAEAWRAAAGRRLALNRYRPNSPAMILDLPSEAPQQDVGRRVASLRDELSRAELPNADQRWKQWTRETFGTEWAPPKAVSSGLDFVFSQADPTVFLPLATGAKSLATAGMAGARSMAKDFAKDQAVEQAIGHAVTQGVGGAVDGKARTSQEIADANATRKAMHGRLVNDGTIEKADDDAWLRLQKDGLVSPWAR